MSRAVGSSGWAAKVRGFVVVRNQGFKALARRADVLVDLPMPVVLARATGSDRWLNRAARQLLCLTDSIVRFDPPTAWRVEIANDETGATAVGSDSGLTIEQFIDEALIGRCVDDLRIRLWVPPFGRSLIVAVSTQPLIDVRGHIEGALVILRDDERAARREADLRNSARVDPLTGLANRRCLTERLADIQRQRPSELLAFIAIDVDHFKRCNDAYGHTVGDSVLAAIGERLLSEVRTGDTAVRLGGDEFAVLCDVASRSEAESIAHRMLTLFDSPLAIGGKQIRLSASIGVAVRNPASDPFDPGALLDLADRALYEAKNNGRDRVVVSDADIIG